MRLSKLLWILWIPYHLAATDLVHQLYEHNIEICLENPLYAQGSISTHEGGTLEGPSIRIQAQQLEVQLEHELTVTASNHVLIHFGPYLFVGDSITYNLTKKQGTITCGTLGLEPWFLRSHTIELHPDGSYTFHDLSMTTTQSLEPEWTLSCQKASINTKQQLEGNRLILSILNIPLFYLPRIRADLNMFYKSPIRYRVRWGGEQGPRFGILYRFYSTPALTVNTRLDYRLNRGLGGGIETDSTPANSNHNLFTRNYLARDSSRNIPSQRTRFRFQGIYEYLSPSQNTSIHLSYDKLSDKFMATDYHEKDLELKTGKKTEANLRHQHPLAITNLYAKLKINNFQSVKQELPSVTTTLYPLHYGPCVFQNRASIGLLDYRYANTRPKFPNFHAARLLLNHKSYASHTFRFLHITPSFESSLLIYTNSQNGTYKYLAIGTSQLLTSFQLKKQFGALTHTIEYHTKLSHTLTPTVNPNDHYIFDIHDGYAQLLSLEIGTTHLLQQLSQKTLETHLNLHTFLDPKTHSGLIPHIQWKSIWKPTPTVQHTLSSTWNLQNQFINSLNYKIDYTVSDQLAFSLEYRQRSPYAWRKSDPTNFYLDSFRSKQDLLNSLASDRRNTLLIHSYFKFHPNWALNIYLRHGWKRKQEPHYLEYDLSLLTTLRSLWHIKFSYQKKTDDHRFAIYFNLSLDKPYGQVCSIQKDPDG